MQLLDTEADEDDGSTDDEVRPHGEIEQTDDPRPVGRPTIKACKPGHDGGRIAQNADEDKTTAGGGGIEAMCQTENQARPNGS